MSSKKMLKLEGEDNACSYSQSYRSMKRNLSLETETSAKCAIDIDSANEANEEEKKWWTHGKYPAIDEDR